MVSSLPTKTELGWPNCFHADDEIAVLVEDLDPAVHAVDDIDAALRSADEDVVGFVEIAGRRSLVSPAS